MSRRIFPALSIMCLFVLLVTMLAGCQPTVSSSLLTDDLGREVKLDKVPERIVTHVPSISELLHALGLGDKQVGRSDWDDYPEQVKAIPSIGGYFDPSVEKIVSLNPDLVLTDGHVDYLMTRLGELNIPYFVLNPKNIEGIYENIELVGELTGAQSQAQRLVADMRTHADTISDRIKGAPAPRVFYIVDGTDLNNPWTAGPGSFIDALITGAGGQNIGARASVAWAKFSIEEVVNSDPEVIIAPTEHGTALVAKSALENHPAWKNVSAVKNGRIGYVDGNLVGRSGPRIIEGLEEIARIVHPDAFK